MSDENMKWNTMPSLLGKMRRRTSSHLGIDLANHSLKVVELRQTQKGVELIHAAVAPLGPGSHDVATLGAQLHRLLRDQGIRTRRAVVGIGGEAVAVRRLTLPDLPEEDIPGAIRWQAGKSFPFPMEDAALAVQVISKSGAGDQGKVEVLAVAATREAVMEKVTVIQEAGLDCLGVLAEPHIWLQLWQSAGLFKEGVGSQAVIDLGLSKTGIHIFQGADLQFSRYISTSGNALTEELCGKIRVGERQVIVDTSRAESLKHQYGIPAEGDQNTTEEGIPLSHIAVRMRPVLEKMETEISRSFDYYGYQFHGSPISRVLLAGGGSQLRGIESFFSEWFDMEVAFLDPLTSLVGEDALAVLQLPEASRSVLALATGLALPMTSQFNLLPATGIGQPGRWQNKAQMAYAALGLLLLLPVGLYAWQGERRVSALRHAASLSEGQFDRYRAVLEQYERLQARNRELDGKLDALPDLDIRGVPLAEALRVISQVIPEKISLTGLNFARDKEGDLPKLRLRGLVFSSDKEAFPQLTKFMEDLAKTSIFHSVQIGTAGESKVAGPAALDFEVVCSVY
jgi:type IV pilus assembly protein PilM